MKREPTAKQLAARAAFTAAVKAGKFKRRKGRKANPKKRKKNPARKQRKMLSTKGPFPKVNRSGKTRTATEQKRYVRRRKKNATRGYYPNPRASVIVKGVHNNGRVYFLTDAQRVGAEHFDSTRSIATKFGNEEAAIRVMRRIAKKAVNIGMKSLETVSA